MTNLLSLADPETDSTLIFNSAAGLDFLGQTVSDAGDVNGDGFDDFIVGTPSNSGFGGGGAIYVIFGNQNGFSTDIDVTSLDGTNGFVVTGKNAGDSLGRSASALGDINGDGIDDIIVGAPGAGNFGEAYVIFGTNLGFPARIDPSDLNGSNGFTLLGVDNPSGRDNFGRAVGSAGDINGDGFNDFVVSTPDMFVEGGMAGTIYLIYGGATFPGSLNLSNLSSNDGFTITATRGTRPAGEAPELLGASVSTAGDVNGDGVDDLVIGAPGAFIDGSSESGQAFVVFGRTGGFSSNLDLSTLNGTTGFSVTGEFRHLAGISVSGAVDINGDGLDDVIIGAPALGSLNNSYTYVVFGSNSGFPSRIRFDEFNGSNGFVIRGPLEEANFGSSVSAAGDIDGDGFDDIIISAADPAGAGISGIGGAYVILGMSTRFPDVLVVSNLGGRGFFIEGVDVDDEAGLRVSGAGDVNGDGFDDIIIGATQADQNGQNQAGEAYIIFGSPTIGQTADTGPTTGSSSDDNLKGGVGSDTLEGREGNDTLEGGEGEEDIIDGGPGIDTTSYESSASGVFINLQAGIAELGDASGDILRNIENVNGSRFADRLTGDTQNNRLFGDLGNDTLSGGAGRDTLEGAGGDDILQGDADADLLEGSAGDDLLVGGSGGDTLDGGSGSDTASYQGSAAAVTVNLGAGIAAGGDAAGDDLRNIENITGSGFADRLIGDATDNRLSGGAGGDTLIGGNGNDTAEGGDGDDTFFAGGGDVGDDLFVGGSGDDLMAAGDGADLLVGDGAEAAGLQGNSGTAGSDTLFGGNGDDTLLGGSWTDSNGNGTFDVGEQSIAGSATNVAYGGAGNDVVYGANGADTLGGGAGNDTLTGGSGTDILYGGQGALDNDDVFRGGAGADTVFGSAGADIINGQTGADQLFGGSGEDTIDGGDGTDSLFGGAGDDELTGGADGDVFFFAGDHGRDVITDFDVSEDTLFLENTVTDFTDLASVQAAASETTQNGQAGLLIDTGDGNSVFLIGLGSNDLTASNLSL